MAGALPMVDMGPQGVDKSGLMTRLRTNADATLTTVRIRGSQDADDMRRLAEALSTNHVCTHVFLDYNCCGSRGAQELATVLPHSKTLRHVGLRGNEVGDDGALALVSALGGGAKLTSLDLRGNNISSRGMEAISQALRRNRTLTALDLRGNATAEPAAAVIEAVLRKNSAAQRRREMAAVFSAKLCAFDVVAVLPAALSDTAVVASPGAAAQPPFWLAACLCNAASPHDGGVGYRAAKKGARWRKGADVVDVWRFELTGDAGVFKKVQLHGQLTVSALDLVQVCVARCTRPRFILTNVQRKMVQQQLETEGRGGGQ